MMPPTTTMTQCNDALDSLIVKAQQGGLLTAEEQSHLACELLWYRMEKQRLESLLNRSTHA